MPKINRTAEEFLQSVIIINDEFVAKSATNFGICPMKKGIDLKEHLLTVDEPYVFESQILYRFRDYKYFSEESGVSKSRIEKLLTENNYVVTREFKNIHNIKSRTGNNFYKEGFEGKRYQKDNQICIIYQDFEGPIGGIPAEFICDYHTMTLLVDNFNLIKFWL